MYYPCSENRDSDQLRGYCTDGAVTAQMICAFVSSYAKIRLSHDMALFVAHICELSLIYAEGWRIDWGVLINNSQAWLAQ